MAKSNPRSSLPNEAGEEYSIRDNDFPERTSSQIKRTRWGTTPFPIPTATMSLDEEITLQASKRNDTPSSLLSPNAEPQIDPGGKYMQINLTDTNVKLKPPLLYLNDI